MSQTTRTKQGLLLPALTPAAALVSCLCPVNHGFSATQHAAAMGAPVPR